MSDKTEYSQNTVILVLEEEKVTCDKEVLIKNSDYFKAMFEGNFLESKQQLVKLEGVRSESFNNLLKIVWDETYIEILECVEKIIAILEIACMLQFNQKDLITNYLIKCLTPLNSLLIWFRTEEIGLLPISIKAKAMSLLHFENAKDSKYFLELNLEELCLYLGNIYLEPTNETSVLKAAIQWYNKNIPEIEQEKTTVIYKILSCLDFNSISDCDIENLKNDPIVNVQLVSILDCIVKSRKNDKGVNTPLAISEILSKCKSRYPPLVPCFLLRNNDDLEMHVRKFQKTDLVQDPYKRKRRQLVLSNTYIPATLVAYYDCDNSSAKYLSSLLDFANVDHGLLRCDLSGFQIIPYKQFLLLFGGEFLLGHGNWNRTLWIYDSLKQNFHRTVQLPFARRHFESCVSGSYLYIVGGTGNYRIVQQNMFWYNCVEDKWSTEILLPCPSLQIKCCQFQNKLFLLSLSSMCAYQFDHANSSWQRIELPNSSTVIPKSFTLHFMCSYKNKIYLKGDTLVELTLSDGNLVVTQIHSLPKDPSDSFIEAIFCCGTIYSLYQHIDLESEEASNGEKSDSVPTEIHEKNKNVFKLEVLKINDSDTLQVEIRNVFEFHRSEGGSVLSLQQ